MGHSEIAPLGLTSQEKSEIVAFLLALEGPEPILGWFGRDCDRAFVCRTCAWITALRHTDELGGGANMTNHVSVYYGRTLLIASALLAASCSGSISGQKQESP